MRIDETLQRIQASAAEVGDGILSALPNVAIALSILAIGLALAWILRVAVRKAFRASGRRDRSGAAADAWQQTIAEDNAGELAASGVFWLVVVTTIIIAVDALDVALLRRWMAVLASFLPRIASAAAVMLGGIIVGRFAGAAVAKTAYRVPASQARRLSRLTHVSIVVAAALIAASQLGLDVSFLTSAFLLALASMLGGAALAFALGARGVVADILAMHYFSQAYGIGQVVRIGPDQGRIVRTTRTCVYLQNAEGELSIPGRDFAGSRCVLVSEGSENA